MNFLVSSHGIFECLHAFYTFADYYPTIVLHTFFSGNHLGREKVLGALSEKYYFVGMNNKVREYLLNCSSCRTRFKLSEGMSDGSTSAISDYDDMDDSDSNVSISEDCKPIKSEWPARSQEALHFWDIVSVCC